MQSKVSRRLKQSPAPEVIKYIFGPRTTRPFFANNFDLLTQINFAHLIMLEKQGILDSEKSCLLAQALIEMHTDGPDAVELDPAREEAYFNYEAHLIKKVGHDLGGRLHTARSRNDIGATNDRIRARDFTVKIVNCLAGVIDAALKQATEYVDCVMPGYTHMQAAQPITYGYYLSGVVEAWLRDYDRLLHTLNTIDECPLGSCALAGTSFPIDRTLASALLGFSGPTNSALDGVASRDFALELSAHLSILMITCSRFVQDVYIWSTPEFGYLSLPDSIAGTSSIMPQKKNPVVLEYLRGKTAHVIGLTSAGFTTVKSTHFTHSGDSSRESTRGCWESCEETLKALELMRLLVDQVAPNRSRMSQRASEDFSTVTDLADLLVREADVSFRDAHHIIGAVVRTALDRDITAIGITPEMIDDSAIQEIGKSVILDANAVRQCLDPERNVSNRRSFGGPSPGSVSEQLKRQRTGLETRALNVGNTIKRVEMARIELQNQILALAAASPHHASKDIQVSR
ncbi:argininosuccinate lyase [Alcaligenaceae bacterium B3P038]|nr:argininosuccinate lyase [Alcaligenaceae bacterium B3P038]